VRYSSCWGFVQNGLEYGVIGSTEGHHIFQLTAADSFQLIDFVPGRYVSSQAITREYKTYQNYLYATADEGSGSLQIMDLSYLPDSVVLVADIQNTTIGKIHNLFIDTSNALLFACSVTPFLNGQEMSLVPLKVFSLQDPLNPTILWEGPNDISEVHDVFVRDNLAILNCGYDGIRVYNFTNPTSPQFLSNLSFYQEQGYNHQGWLTPNNETYVFADETPGTRIKKAQLTPSNNLTIQSVFGTENEPYLKTAHNIQCTNEFAFVAYYNDGLRIFDIRTNPPQEIAFYDTHQDINGNTFSMWGAWGIYTLLPSQRILVSDRISGFFLFSFDRNLFTNVQPTEDIRLLPNPSNSNDGFTVQLPYKMNATSICVYDSFGRKIVEKIQPASNLVTIDSIIVSGIYYVQIEFVNYLNEIEKHIEKLMIN
jgi:choice-of-anchor B domain-containing protein